MRVPSRSDELFNAISKGATKNVKMLLDDGCDPNSRMSDAICTTALIHAVSCNKLNSVKLLLRTRAINVNTRDVNGRTACMYAADKGLLDILSVLVKRDADLTAIDKGGASALMLAAQWGHCDCLQFLFNQLKERKFIDCQDNTGCTALMYAAKNGKADCVRRLVDAMANVNLVDHEKGYTALMHALKHGEPGCARKILYSPGCVDVNVLSKNGEENALSIALQGSLMDDFSVVEDLLRKGADMRLKVCQVFLHEMVARDQKKIVRLMVMRGCPPFDRECYQPCFNFSFSKVPISPIAVALLSGYSDTARYFVAIKFFTHYDLTKLPNDEEIRRKIHEEAGDGMHVLSLLDHLRSMPSRKTLGLGTVSEMLNAQRDATGGQVRRNRVFQLELPNELKSQLIFDTKAVRMCLLHWHDMPLDLSGKTTFIDCTCIDCKGMGGVKVRA